MMDMPKNSDAAAAVSRRPVIVHVRIKSDAGDGDFEMTSTDIPVRHVKHNGKDVPTLTFDNNQGGKWEDGFWVTFKLKDDTHQNYGFYVDPQDPEPDDPDLNGALWVKCIDGDEFCPAEASTWHGFRPFSIKDNRRSLTVNNPNECEQKFGFALHFSKPGESEPSLTFDPIGDDRNGQAR